MTLMIEVELMMDSIRSRRTTPGRPRGRRRSLGARHVARPGAGLRVGRDLGLLAAGRGRAGPPPPVVSVVEARRMTVPVMAEPIGTTRALQEVSVRARVRGFLKEIHFEEGGDVKKGQLLFVIDEEPFKAKLDAARRRWSRPRPP